MHCRRILVSPNYRKGKLTSGNRKQISGGLGVGRAGKRNHKGARGIWEVGSVIDMFITLTEAMISCVCTCARI